MEWLKTFYLSTGLFGILVLVLDLVFSFGDAAEAGDSGDEGDEAIGEDGDEAESPSDGENLSVFHFRDGESKKIKDRSGKFILKLLSMLRNLVYFCAGFGGMGFFALFGNKSPRQSLLWSIPFGVAVVMITRLLKRIQRSTLDSQVDPSMLLMEPGEVIVKLEKGQIGKVRVRLGQGICDYYAVARNAEDEMKVGETVRIVEVSSDQVMVEKVEK